MNMENSSEKKIEAEARADEQSFEEMRKLLAEGWRYKGNHFDGKAYQVMLEKKDDVSGEIEKRSFPTARPYPDMVNSAGEIKKDKGPKKSEDS